jgi:hypothetical protein
VVGHRRCRHRHRRGDGLRGAFSFGSAPPIINEDVTTADDIMAASHATELDEEATDDSELAKLLAKVQARLAAYE